MVDKMRTRAELYATIKCHAYEELDSSIVKSTVPTDIPSKA